MHRVFPRIRHTDPSAFSTAFAAWAAVVGLSLVVPGNYFDTAPIWNTLEDIHHNDTPWGWGMIADAVLLYLSPRALGVSYRAAITLFSAVMWGLLGASCVYNGWVYGGYVPIVGMFSLCCATQALLATEQWVWTQDKWESR